MVDQIRQGVSVIWQVLARGDILVTSFGMWIIAKLKGVELGTNAEFVRFARFSRMAGSTIRIHHGCRFRSDRASNRVGVNRACYISTLRRGAVLLVGPHCAFSGTVIASAKHIELGSFVRCGANTTVMDSDFHGDDPRSGEAQAVVIEDHVWLGLNVIVQKGVRIGRNSVIAAGSVVTRDIPPNVMAGGIPAKVIKEFSAEVVDRTEAFYREKRCR